MTPPLHESPDGRDPLPAVSNQQPVSGAGRPDGRPVPPAWAPLVHANPTQESLVLECLARCGQDTHDRLRWYAYELRNETAPVLEQLRKQILSAWKHTEALHSTCVLARGLLTGTLSSVTAAGGKLREAVTGLEEWLATFRGVICRQLKLNRTVTGYHPRHPLPGHPEERPDVIQNACRAAGADLEPILVQLFKLVEGIAYMVNPAGGTGPPAGASAANGARPVGFSS